MTKIEKLLIKIQTRAEIIQIAHPKHYRSVVGLAHRLKNDQEADKNRIEEIEKEEVRQRGRGFKTQGTG